MIREPDIFPTDSVLQAIDDEDFSIYFFVRPKRGTVATTLEVHYGQLSALLALAGEEWPHNSPVPPTLCRKISKNVLHYADEHDLDRKTEIDELLQPIHKYSMRREAKQSARLLPWILPATVVTVATGNPLAVYGAFLASNVVESKNIEKG
jgi:hypothetical protein